MIIKHLMGDIEMTALEEQLIEEIKTGMFYDFERALLIISGCETEEQIAGYQRKLNVLTRAFRDSMSGFPQYNLRDHHSRARALFDFLWAYKQKRYISNWKLTSAIDAQLDTKNDSDVGNCCVQNTLYNVLAVREQLNIALLANFFHFVSILNAGNRRIVIDNTDRKGFGASLPERQEKNLGFAELTKAQIIAMHFYYRAEDCRKNGNIETAIESITTTIELAPDYAAAYNYRAQCYIKKARDLNDNEISLALQDLDSAIVKDPKFSLPYLYRAMLYLQSSAPIGQLFSDVLSFTLCYMLQKNRKGSTVAWIMSS